jgi:hypothetical protein
LEKFRGVFIKSLHLVIFLIFQNYFSIEKGIDWVYGIVTWSTGPDAHSPLVSLNRGRPNCDGGPRSDDVNRFSPVLIWAGQL